MANVSKTKDCSGQIICPKSLEEGTSCPPVPTSTVVHGEMDLVRQGDPVHQATDAVTREWKVDLRDRSSGVMKTYNISVADYTSVNPDAPRIVIGVNGHRWSVEVHYGFSAYPLCGPPCTYTWQADGHTFELALDAISLRTWRGGLLLFVNGREAESKHSKALFWFRRFTLRAVMGLVWIGIGFGIHFAASHLAKGEENFQRILIVLLFLGLSLITMVMVLPCAIGLSYLVVGCLGVCKFGLANVMDRHTDDVIMANVKTYPRRAKKSAPGSGSLSKYVIMEEESAYGEVPLQVNV